MPCMASKKAALLIVAAAAIFATNGLYVRFLDLPVEALAAGRLFVGATALYVYYRFTGKSLRIKSVDGARLLFAAALFNALAFYTNFAAYALLPVAMATVLLYTSSFFSVVLEHFFVKEKRLRKENWLAVFLGLAGVGIIAYGHGLGTGFQANAGLFVGLASGVAYACTMVLAKKSIKANGCEQTTFYYVLVAGLLLAPFALIAHPRFTLETLGWLAVFGVVNSFVGVSMLLRGLKAVKPHHAIILVSLEMVFAAVYAWLLLGEAITPHVAVGGALIVVAAYLAEKEG